MNKLAVLVIDDDPVILKIFASSSRGGGSTWCRSWPPKTTTFNGDTARFAVQPVRRRWSRVGKACDPDAVRLLITADTGGLNGYRDRAWKTELARFAEESGLEVIVCHYPPGTSKRNRIVLLPVQRRDHERAGQSSHHLLS